MPPLKKSSLSERVPVPASDPAPEAPPLYVPRPTSVPDPSDFESGSEDIWAAPIHQGLDAFTTDKPPEIPARLTKANSDTLLSLSRPRLKNGLSEEHLSELRTYVNKYFSLNEDDFRRENFLPATQFVLRILRILGNWGTPQIPEIALSRWIAINAFQWTPNGVEWTNSAKACLFNSVSSKDTIARHLLKKPSYVVIDPVDQVSQAKQVFENPSSDLTFEQQRLAGLVLVNELNMRDGQPITAEVVTRSGSPKAPTKPTTSQQVNAEGNTNEWTLELSQKESLALLKRFKDKIPPSQLLNDPTIVVTVSSRGSKNALPNEANPKEKDSHDGNDDGVTAKKVGHFDNVPKKQDRTVSWAEGILRTKVNSVKSLNAALRLFEGILADDAEESLRFGKTLRQVLGLQNAVLNLEGHCCTIYVTCHHKSGNARFDIRGLDGDSFSKVSRTFPAIVAEKI